MKQYITESYRKLSAFVKMEKVKSLRGILIFILLTVVIHIFWKFWSIRLAYFPIAGFMDNAFNFMIGVVLAKSKWAIIHILGISATIDGQTIWLQNGWGISIGEGCTSLKQISQFVLLMVFYPGPWKHKLWYIPFGAVVVYLTNLFRILLLAVFMNFRAPQWFIDFAHNDLLRIIFYIAIFVLWLIWAEVICKPKKS